jgi:hypothetical protein
LVLPGTNRNAEGAHWPGHTLPSRKQLWQCWVMHITHISRRARPAGSLYNAASSSTALCNRSSTHAQTDMHQEQPK